MEGHVELIALAEIRTEVSRPLVGLGQKHFAWKLLIEPGTEIFKNGVGFGQVLAVRAFALDQVGNRVQPEAVDAHIQPELHYIPHFFPDFWVVIIEIGLMAEEAMPVIFFRDRVPCPVGEFGVYKNNAGTAIASVGLAPHIPVAARVDTRTARLLEPGMLIRGVIQHHFDDHPDTTLVGSFQKCLEVVQRAVTGMDRSVIRDVVPVIPQRGREERHQPDDSNA